MQQSVPSTRRVLKVSDVAKAEDRHRRKKELWHKEKHKVRFAELGLDANGEKLDNFSLYANTWSLSHPSMI
jgi:hypothetical protein